MANDSTPQRLLRLPEVLARVAPSKSTLYARVRAGTFPKPVHLGTLSAWVESEIFEWIQEQIAARARAA
ncbi:MAG TPA: AlpA family transcriptional regulator [Stenotrophomonas sp.]|jgi:prophage regulatory protein